VRASRPLLLLTHLARFTDTRPAGRPRKLTKAQRRAVADVITAGPQAAGSPSGGWHTPMMPDLIQSRFGVSSPPHSLAPVRPNLGVSSQQARVVSAQLKETTRLEWRRGKGPRLVRHARQRKARWLFGDAVSLAPWGALSSPWAPTGEHPDVPTRGTRKGYQVFGLIDSCSGQVFDTTHAGRFNAASSTAFWRDVWAQTRRPVLVIHDGARYPTRHALQQFVAAHAARWTSEPLPSSAPDCHPIEHLWKQVKKQATHLKYFPECTPLPAEVDRALLHFAHTPRAITVLMARYCETLGAMAA
jgi:transposase